MYPWIHPSFFIVLFRGVGGGAGLVTVLALGDEVGIVGCHICALSFVGGVVF